MIGNLDPEGVLSIYVYQQNVHTKPGFKLHLYNYYFIHIFNQAVPLHLEYYTYQHSAVVHGDPHRDLPLPISAQKHQSDRLLVIFCIVNVRKLTFHLNFSENELFLSWLKGIWYIVYN